MRTQSINLKLNTQLLGVFILLSIGSYFSQNVQAKEKTPEIIVYKSPTCGCCQKWVKHLETAGFNVKTINKRNMNPVKAQFGVKRQYQSCHTAKVGGYFIEGHVSAKEIRRLLKEKPNAKGLAVPGMPMGSPGMEGHRKDMYSVLLINNKNKAEIYYQY